MGTASTCLGFESGVRDFRREAGAWNMIIGFTSNVQLVGFTTFTIDGSINSYEYLLFTMQGR
jgi:NAD-dependent SIR2 family protein deacetylase